MNQSQHELWRRIEAFEIDEPGAPLTFSRRLARENGWSHEFALRVVAEYKRFLLLAMTAGHEVTPSDEVDQAWHLHLTYTRSYWSELCGEVLGKPLHHGPTKGGDKEGIRFEDQYERTLASYREAFGQPPPTDIWPSADVRFGEATSFVRVNRQHVWLVSKPWRVGRLSDAAAYTAAAAIVPVFALTDAEIAFFSVVALMAGFAVLRTLTANKSGKQNKKDGSTGCGGWWGGSGCGADGGSGCGASGCGGGGCGGCGG